MRSRLGFGLLVAGAVLALVSGSRAVEAREARDRVFVADGIELQRLMTVAVLPAVSITEDEVATRQAEFGWVALYSRSRTRWIPADEVRRRIAAAGDGSNDFDPAVKAQIWRSGAVDSLTAERLCRMLGVDAVLSLRVDRWEMVDGWRGVVGLSATLCTADGQRVWSATGTAGHGRGPLPENGNVSVDHGPDWSVAVVQDNRTHRTTGAFCTLLARWAPLLPTPVFEQELPADVLALIHDN